MIQNHGCWPDPLNKTMVPQKAVIGMLERWDQRLSKKVGYPAIVSYCFRSVKPGVAPNRENSELRFDMIQLSKGFRSNAFRLSHRMCVFVSSLALYAHACF